jgi:RNA polymerase sigma factor (sigma-70 family)
MSTNPEFLRPFMLQRGDDEKPRRGSIRRYLFGRAFDAYRAHLGRRWEKALDTGDGGASPDPGPAEVLEGSERQQVIRRAIAELPEDQLEAVMLYYYVGLTSEKAAEILGLNWPSSFHSRLTKALNRLAKQLSALFGGR